ncbi:uncharacterized protein LOC133649153 [Entelurus aequoreus]|uniref:uncharacterized protein LOC133649153 n=1 Tax=Entelurus aequoreus TaxID=161455 RepID=UPI002B1E7AB6|nr:uncharacterized protein LOC133649153 [Entelurus aequoreus]
MKVTAGLLVLLLTVCHAEEQPCDGRKDGVQCYGKLGETMLLRLMDNDLGLYRYRWETTTTILMTGGIGGKVNLSEKRFSFTPEEGLMKIIKLERRDSGKYTLNIFNEGGRLIISQTLQLFVEDSVPGANSTRCDQPTLTLPAAYYWLIIQNGILAPTVLVMIGVMIFFALKKKLSKRHRAQEDQEVTYVNVSRETNASQERGRAPTS